VSDFGQPGFLIRTERLVLRPLRRGDEESLFALYSDPSFMRYWNTPPWSSLAEAAKVIDEDLAAMPAGQYLRLGIQAAEADSLIGTVSLFAFHEPSRRAELGYGLAPASWGHGYMTEALSALLEYAFGPLGLNRIEADIDPGNEASARALARLGFVQEGYFRERWIVGGQVSHSAMYGLLRADWDGRR
jgi:ribosomal-protein-alanine N-acetyltransferase